MGVRADDIYVHIVLGHPSLATARDEARTKHVLNAPGTRLSVAKNIAGTEAIIKIRGGRNWTPTWISDATFVKRVYRADEHDLVKALIRIPEWTPPE